MANFKSQLPPLNSLLYFEAAARHLSFTLAGAELGVSQAAISRQIERLEQSLNCLLFERHHKRVALTCAGHTLLPTVSEALKLLNTGVKSVENQVQVMNRNNQINPKVTISATVAFCNLQLAPWLRKLQQQHPEIPIQVLAQDRDIDIVSEGIDLAIGCGEFPKSAHINSDFLYSDEIFPICSANYLQHKASIKHCKDLLSHPLLHLDEEHWRALHWDPIDWSTWFASQGVTSPFKVRGLKINNYSLLLEAVKNSQGIALGWQHLVADLIEEGVLVKPLTASFVSQRNYFLLSHERNLTQNAIIVKDWIKANANPRAQLNGGQAI